MSADEDTSTNRRSVLKGIAGGAALGAAGVGALTLTSSPAAAIHTDPDLQLEGASMETTRGEVAYLAAGFQGYVMWENQPEPISHIFNRTEFNWDTKDEHGADEWRELSSGTREVTNTAGRDWDTSEPGRDGHFTNHIPNPDGSLRVFVEDDGTEELRGSDTFDPHGNNLPPETEGSTWIIARDDDAVDRLKDEDVDFPYAVDFDYEQVPPLDASAIPVPDEGESHTLVVGYRKDVRILDGDDPSADVVDTAEPETTFELEITHLEGELTVRQIGETAADGV